MQEDAQQPDPPACDATVMRENDNSLRHCTRPAGHVWDFLASPVWRQHSDGKRVWDS